MKLRKNAFSYFASLVFLFCVLFSMACVFRRLGDGQEYPYLLKGAWLLGMLALSLALLACSALWGRLDMTRRLDQFPRLTRAAEYLAAALLLAAGGALRYAVIQQIPMAPDSDYKTYYEMAALLNQNALIEAGVGYCDYVSLFPHVFGYPRVLSTVLGLFGESVRTALIFNLVLEVGGCLLVWRIARLTGGRLCGLVALAAAAFLPSAILYSNFVASEPLFTFVLLLAIWLFALSLRASRRQERHPWLCAAQLTAMALTLAFGSFIRPMAVIFLVAAVICMLSGEKRLPALPRNDIPLGLRLTDKGWKRCVLVCAVYFSASSLFTMGTSYAVDRELAGSGASYGYNLLVGLNLESYGGWNQEDADYLYQALEATGSAQEAQLACRDMALERLHTDPRALLNLFVHKFDVLWGNDDYGASWNILFLDQQGNLTPERERFLYRMMDVSDLYYLTLLFCAGVFGCAALRRRPDAMYACLLLFCGTVALHLLVENQNLYHYHAIPLLALMTGAAISVMAGLMRRVVMEQIERKREAAQERAARTARVQLLEREEAERVRLRAEALHAQFDMGKALTEGHIQIVTSQAIQADAESVPPDIPPAVALPREEPAQVGQEETAQAEQEETAQVGQEETAQVGQEETAQVGQEETAQDAEQETAVAAVAEPAHAAEDVIEEKEEEPRKPEPVLPAAEPVREKPFRLWTWVAAQEQEKAKKDKKHKKDKEDKKDKKGKKDKKRDKDKKDRDKKRDSSGKKKKKDKKK